MVSFMLGALVYWDQMELAAAITVVVVLVLTFKPNLQSFAARVNREDIWAGLEFAIVWIVVLPILPNRTYGPLDVLNPHEIWLMVVLVSGINLAGYVLSQVYGAQRGIRLAGVLGGLVSSTFVTFDFARRSRRTDQQHFSDLFALAIAIASTGMFFRVLLIALIANVALGLALTIPMLAGAAVMALGVAVMAWRARQESEEGIETPDRQVARSPFALRPALQFALIFAIVLWLSKAAEVTLGETGSYLSGIIGGIPGLDAITLSMGKLASTSGSTLVPMRAVTFGAASNMAFKGVIALWLGGGTVRREILPLFLLAAAASIAAAFLIPMPM
jgi:uncharacterized membrane protein (DUF4010 family)